MQAPVSSGWTSVNQNAGSAGQLNLHGTERLSEPEPMYS